MSLYPTPERRSELERRIQLRQADRVRPEQPAVDEPGRLQHQRQHEAVRALQHAARNAEVPDRPVVAEWEPGALSDAYSRQEQVRLGDRQPDPRVQPDDDERVHLRIYVHRFPNVFEDPSKVDRTALGASFKGVFKNKVAQIPACYATGEMAAMLNPGGFEVGGNRGLFADKHLPSIQNNLTKVWGTHTVKGGFYWEYIINNQPANGFTNGQLGFDTGNARSSGSPYGDLLLGRINDYQEQSFNRLNNIGYHTFEFFVQDAWKVTRRLTLDLGLRASHFQPW